MANRLDDGLKIAKNSARAASRCARFNARNKRFILANESGEREKKKGCGWASEWQKEDMLITCSCCEESGDKLVVYCGDHSTIIMVQKINK